MPGAGDFPAGSGPAGSDPIITSPAAPTLTPGAIRYEGRTRGWVMGDDGQYVKVHPIEQAVALSMCVRKGSLKSAPNVGNTLFEIEYLGTPELGADIEDRVRNSFPLSQLVANGDVEIVRIEHDEKDALAVALYFKNLRSVDPSKQLKRPAVI